MTRRHDDPGLAPERTVLAWQRCGAAMLVVACLLMRLVIHEDWRLPMIAAALLGLCLAAWVVLQGGARHVATVAAIRGDPHPSNARSVSALAALTLALAGASAVAVGALLL